MVRPPAAGSCAFSLLGYRRAIPHMNSSRKLPSMHRNRNIRVYDLGFRHMGPRADQKLVSSIPSLMILHVNTGVGLNLGVEYNA
jgi:hypothetical protein